MRDSCRFTMGDNDFQIRVLEKLPLREDITKRDPFDLRMVHGVLHVLSDDLCCFLGVTDMKKIMKTHIANLKTVDSRHSLRILNLCLRK